MSKTIVVVGATGNQGSSVARTFLSLPGWHVRCLTRDPSSDRARALAAQGAEVVQGDLGSVSSLKRAFAGAYAIFLNTDFWGPQRRFLAAGLDVDTSSHAAFSTEVLHGRNAAVAAAAVMAEEEAGLDGGRGIPTLQRFVYSALGPMSAASTGRYSCCLHWEAKVAVVDHIRRQHPLLASCTSLIYLGGYYTNRLVWPKPLGSGETATYALKVPNPAMRMPLIDPLAATGPFVRCLVEDEPAGTQLLAYGSLIDMEGAATAWSAVTGRPAAVVQTPPDALAAAGMPQEIVDGIAFLSEFDYLAGAGSYITPAQLKTPVQTQSFASFLERLGAKALL